MRIILYYLCNKKNVCIWLKSRKHYPVRWQQIQRTHSNTKHPPWTQETQLSGFLDSEIISLRNSQQAVFPIHKHWVYVWKNKNFIMEIRKTTWMTTKMHSMVSLSAAHNCSSFPFWWSCNRQVSLTVYLFRVCLLYHII